MSKKTISVTYAVAFTEPVSNGKRIYQPNRTYQFKTRVSNPADAFDAAFTAIHVLFGCIKRNVYYTFLPLKSDPTIISIQERALSC